MCVGAIVVPTHLSNCLPPSGFDISPPVTRKGRWGSDSTQLFVRVLVRAMCGMGCAEASLGRNGLVWCLAPRRETRSSAFGGWRERGTQSYTMW